MVDYLTPDEPCFGIGVAARIVRVHSQTLRYYERAGLIRPSRTSGRNRLYSQSDIERLRQIKRLTDDLGLNLAGVEVILRMADKIVELEDVIADLRNRLGDVEVSNDRNRNREAHESAGGRN